MKIKKILFSILFIGIAFSVQAQDLVRFTHVNRDKEAVRKLYNHVFVPARDYPQGWNEPGNCNPGTLSPATLNARLAEINYFRKMAGVDPVSLKPEYNKKAQAAAYLMFKNGTLSHNPPTTWNCYSKEGAMGAGSCNLGYGGGIFGYITDFGATNQDCGHRMYILSAQKEALGYGGTNATDAIYVFGNVKEVDSLPEYVAWPPAGFVPMEILSSRWTFSRPGNANYSKATVQLSLNGKSIPLGYSSPTSYGDAGLSFEIADWSEWSSKMVDQKVKVLIKNVMVGDEIGSYSYEVAPFHAAESGAITYNNDYDGRYTTAKDDEEPTVVEETETEPEVTAFADQKLVSLSEFAQATDLPLLTVDYLKSNAVKDLVYDESFCKFAGLVSKLRKEKNPDPIKISEWESKRIKSYLGRQSGLSEEQTMAAATPKFLVLEITKIIPLGGKESFGEIATELATKFAEKPELKAFAAKYKRIRQCGIGLAVKRVDRNGRTYAGVYATLVVAPSGLRASS